MPGCAQCGAVLAHRAARYCSGRCRARAHYLRMMGRAGVDEPEELELVCLVCVQWVVDSRGELGGWCRAERWLLCRPLRPGAEPWEPMSGD